MKLATVMSVGAMCAALASCQDLVDDAKTSKEAARAGVDANDQAAAESRLLLAGVADLSLNQAFAPVTSEQAAVAVALALEARYTPSECIDVVTEGNNISATLTNCTGPWGLREVSGELALEVTVASATSLELAVVGTGLSSRGASFSLTADALYTGGEAPSLVVTSEASGVGRRGVPFTRAGEYTVTWAAACVALDGSWSTTAAGNTRETTVDVEQCEPGCPTGTMVIDGAAGELTITFAGTATATWSTQGLDGEVSLTCEPA